MRKFVGLSLKELEAQLRADPAMAREAAKISVAAGHHKLPWLPQLGPQYEAFHSEADETLYGGAAGGGKTDLLVGLASTAHQRTLLFRRQSTDLDGLWERLIQVLDKQDLVRTKNGVKKRVETTDGRLIEMGHLELPGSEKSWQGRPHDLIGFDEAAQLAESKVAFVIRWLRTTTAGQRCRVVFATNPPLPDLRAGEEVDSSSGDWLKRWFQPWLDPEVPQDQRAQSGEIRWCYMKSSGDESVSVWVDEPGWYVIEDGRRWPEDDPDDDTIRRERLAKARSRTFIQSLVSDNSYLSGSGYIERLSATPEPLRSMLLHGDFTVKGEDHKRQVIPTQWVLDAQERWRQRVEQERIDPHRVPDDMIVLAADIAQGGADHTVLAAMRDDNFFDRLVTRPGRDTPDGPSVITELLLKRESGAAIVLDMTGGWGISTRDGLRDNHHIESISCVASAGSSERIRDMSLGFYNLRAEMWWKMREGLDPKNGFDICLPAGDRLRTQLTSVHYGVRGDEIIVESKDDIKRRLQGASTDEADAVIMAWRYRDVARAKRRQGLDEPIPVAEGGWNPGAQQSRHEVADIDPLAGWEL